jgi:hypothetical protein
MVFALLLGWLAPALAAPASAPTAAELVKKVLDSDPWGLTTA